MNEKSEIERTNSDASNTIVRRPPMPKSTIKETLAQIDMDDKTLFNKRQFKNEDILLRGKLLNFITSIGSVYSEQVYYYFRNYRDSIVSYHLRGLLVEHAIRKRTVGGKILFESPYNDKEDRDQHALILKRAAAWLLAYFGETRFLGNPLQLVTDYPTQITYCIFSRPGKVYDATVFYPGRVIETLQYAKRWFIMSSFDPDAPSDRSLTAEPSYGKIYHVAIVFNKDELSVIKASGMFYAYFDISSNDCTKMQLIPF